MKLKQLNAIVLVLALACIIVGAYQVTTLKNALLPPIKKPMLVLYTSWQGKGAEEIEQTLIAPLEQQLKTLDGLMRIKSSVGAGNAATKLYFPHDIDMDKTYLEVLSQINQVPNWPAQVAPPRVVNQSSGANITLASAMLFSSEEKSKDEYIKVMKGIVEPQLAKVAGISRLEKAFNNTEQRIDITFDPDTLAQYELSTDEVAYALRNLKDQSGNQLTIGSRNYNLHFKGQLTLNELQDLIITVRNGHVVRLAEIATISVTPRDKWGYASFKGDRAYYFSMDPTANVDAMATISEIKQVFKNLNEHALKPYNMQISLSRDDSKSIQQALDQVYGNLVLGIFLACALLFFFFRNIKAISIIFFAVPVCLALVIIGMKLGDYSLNVISLAGMALSIGLLLDAAIIVIDNIFRHLRQNVAVGEAINKGVKEVSGAIISSTLSSIIIFIPIIMMKSSEAQLFIDLAFTISSALMASVVVALVVLPAAARKLLSKDKIVIEEENTQDPKWVNRFTAPARTTWLKYALLAFGLPFALAISYWAAPSFDVLPSPNQNNVNAMILFNEPLSHEAAEQRIAKRVYSRIEAARQLPNTPKFEVYGMFCNTGVCQLYFYPEEEGKFNEFRAWLKEDILIDLPGTVSYVMPGKLLNFALPDNRVVELHLKGDTLPELQKAGRGLLTHLQEAFPDAKVTEDSPLYNRVSRIEFSPNREQLVHLGLTPAKLNEKLVALTDGLYLGHLYAQGNALPLYLKGQAASSIDTLMNTEIAIPGMGLVPLHQLAEVEMSLAPSELLRVDGEATVALEIEPPEGAAIGEFLEQVKLEIAAYIEAYGNEQIYFGYMGSADNLSEFLQEFLNLLAVSVVILTVLMWMTLKSWRLAFAVILSLPLAVMGGMLNLYLIDSIDSQNLDVITMIGFIILLGLVINNAILLVSQFQTGISNGLSQFEAIKLAIKIRRRPIYMSTGTSILGMLPLMLNPADGAEIYRGLAAVIVGGMSMSALLSLSFMSALLSIGYFAKTSNEEELNINSSEINQVT